ncbi:MULTISPECIES: phage major capsid protein [Methylobacterium]|jgi:HK97 family phage major capsid protein|uniref:phage major capsid protein n=1 Tax=Methylobacterium TaxID=407 RepID=UPI0008E44488|nr:MULTISPECIES: phage major capsid protein [Methylobacterium]MBZ6415996.1 phage major capsid protein [Methylobacterium sp.]MBK3399398.1 phage major capsid protein [Methylobacterium ajmalii]MBK3412571.1 phage major capsid protein [Methylobacterium ajmalii]MBK3420428.1 phage major capsid protein [Methylobacterium ajmalii]SFF64000.1 phage major capsid protein, HK97 family [Methylobacterium sp. yr596]
MTQSIQALREERTAKAREARALLDAKTGKEWTPEVKDQVDAIYAAIDRLDEQIARVERVLTIEDSLEQRGRVLSEKNGRSVDENAATIRAEKAIFSAWARGGAEALTDDQRAHVKARRDEAQRVYGAQSVGTGAAGGYLVPRDFAETMLERMAAFGGMRAVATVIQTDGGNAIDYATVDETGQEGEIVGESLAASGQDIAFGTVSIGAYKYSSKTVVVPLELLQDSRIDIEPYINVALATRIARITNRHFTTGTGAGQPRGVVTAAAAGKAGAAGQLAAVTYDDLVDLEHAVDPAYRTSGRWMFHDTTLKALKKLKDGQGRPLWRPGVTGGDPSDILGYGYTVNQHMAPMGASARSLLFGDFKKYLIRDVMAVTLFRFADSKYLEKGQVAFLAWSRHDGNLIDASNDAIKAFQHPAS